MHPSKARKVKREAEAATQREKEADEFKSRSSKQSDIAVHSNLCPSKVLGMRSNHDDDFKWDFEQFENNKNVSVVLKIGSSVYGQWVAVAKVVPKLESETAERLWQTYYRSYITKAYDAEDDIRDEVSAVCLSCVCSTTTDYLWYVIRLSRRRLQMPHTNE